jgi:hypothetical protein
MKTALLDARHPSYAPDVWARYDALYRGGDAFRQHVEYFLPQRAMEPLEVYLKRKTEAYYTGYVGPIVDWFAAKLTSGALVARARKDAAVAGESQTLVDPDPWYAAWKEDVDGAGTDLVDFMRARFTSACVKGRAWWCVEKPDDGEHPPANRAEWEHRQLGDVSIYPIDNDQVLDMEADARGELNWAIVHSLETPREDPRQHERGIVHETWRIYDRETVDTYELRYRPGQDTRPEVATHVGRKVHGFSRVPLVRIGFVGTKTVKVRMGLQTKTIAGAELEGFWLLNRLADAQTAHFRNSAAFDWNIKNTCYAMPVFKIADAEKPPVMGAGYYIMIGTTEEVAWIGPPTAHLSVMSERCDKLQQEIYRVANQLAQGVDNNAAAVGRSGLSKKADASSTEVVLRVYGALVREAIERTYDLVAEGRGDSVAWSIEGFEQFAAADAPTVVAAAIQAQALGIHSVTARKELEMRALDALLPNADQPTKDKMRAEVDTGIDAEEALRIESMVADEEDDEEPVSKPMVADEQEPASVKAPTAEKAKAA